MSNEDRIPKIYVYRLTDPRVDNLIKIGYTIKDDVIDRIDEQFGARADIYPFPYELLHYEDAIANNGLELMDHDVHTELRHRGIDRIKTSSGNLSEFFITDLKTILSAIKAVKKNGNIGVKEEVRTMETLVVKDMYLNKPLTTKTKFSLCKELNLIDSKKRILRWRGVKSRLIDVGYEVEDRTLRIDGRRMRTSTIRIPNNKH